PLPIWAAILRDISLLKNLEQMTNAFVNAACHDLRGPITVIAGLADLMRRAGPGDARLQTRLQDIRDTAQHMSDLVTDLLDLGKIEAGLDADYEPEDVVGLINEALRLVTPHAETRNVTLQSELPAEAIVSVARTRI